jgi:hypothetical protein
VNDRIKAFAEQQHIEADYDWANDIKRDVLAFAQFVLDYNVKPLAIEIILAHPTDGYAGAIDLACQMDFTEKGYFGEVYKSGEQKGQPKESKRVTTINAIIDFKSGRKGFYESHEIQLEAYRQMWNLEFPQMRVDRIFNWSPKDWRSKPTYNFTDQTDSRSLAKLPYLVSLNKIEVSKQNLNFVKISGILDLDKGIEDNFIEIDIYEHLKNKSK